METVLKLGHDLLKISKDWAVWVYFYSSYPQGSLFVKSIPVRGVPVGGSGRDASDRTRSILGKGFPLVAPHSSSNMSKKISSLWKMKEDLCRLTLRKLMLSCLFSHLVFSVMERDGSWQVRSARHIIHQLDSMQGGINTAIVLTFFKEGLLHLLQIRWGSKATFLS